MDTWSRHRGADMISSDRSALLETTAGRRSCRNIPESLKMLSCSVVFHRRGGKCGRAEVTASLQPTSSWTDRAEREKVQKASAWKQTVTLHSMMEIKKRKKKVLKTAPR